MKPLVLTTGEPAGIGPEISLTLADSPVPMVIIGDQALLEERASQLKKKIDFIEYQPGQAIYPKKNTIHLLPTQCEDKVCPGELNVKNANYVLNQLERATRGCLDKEFSGLVTAPIQKSIINQAGIPFTGHTEWLAKRCGVEQVVMMLACNAMRVALVTTHIPLSKVSDMITIEKIIYVTSQVNQSLQKNFKIPQPKLKLAGINPHAGESGYLGREDIEILEPAVEALKLKGIDVTGPHPADTLFTPMNLNSCDAFITMYHDQGLPVLKYAGFGKAANITLGLPIIRTSVDHGTALTLAGTGKADASSLLYAVNTAWQMIDKRKREYDFN